MLAINMYSLGTSIYLALVYLVYFYIINLSLLLSYVHVHNTDILAHILTMKIILCIYKLYISIDNGQVKYTINLKTLIADFENK